MKFTVVIQETISQEFTIDCESINDAIEQTGINYQTGVWVVDNGNLIEAEHEVIEL